jgi:hypothetical protein
VFPYEILSMQSAFTPETHSESPGEDATHDREAVILFIATREGLQFVATRYIRDRDCSVGNMWEIAAGDLCNPRYVP